MKFEFPNFLWTVYLTFLVFSSLCLLKDIDIVPEMPSSRKSMPIMPMPACVDSNVTRTKETVSRRITRSQTRRTREGSHTEHPLSWHFWKFNSFERKVAFLNAENHYFLMLLFYKTFSADDHTIHWKQSYGLFNQLLVHTDRVLT